jgi:16S rRNA processing protein RimM
VVTSSRWHSGVLLVSFEGIADRGAAEGLRGAEVWATVAADEVPAADGEYYDRHLVGLAVLDAAGRQVGRIASVLHLPAQDVLVVPTDQGERLVPFVSALVPVVDLVAGHVQVADLPGLLEDLP